MCVLKAVEALDVKVLPHDEFILLYRYHKHTVVKIFSLRIRIRCFFDSCVRDPGWKKSGPGMNIPDYLSESLETVFRVKNT
jgi:hypothetical protein